MTHLSRLAIWRHNNGFTNMCDQVSHTCRDHNTQGRRHYNKVGLSCFNYDIPYVLTNTPSLKCLVCKRIKDYDNINICEQTTITPYNCLAAAKDNGTIC